MLFNSLEYLWFFPSVVIIYYLLPQKYRWILLLVASYYFYMSWKVEYIFLIIFSTIVDYTLAIKIHKEKNKSHKKFYLIASLFSNLGLLAAFKYANFISENINQLLTFTRMGFHFPYMDILLPVGISFYTFQTLSYTIDVYKGKIEPERNLGRFALFVTYFPQLVAGPIERASTFIPELKRKFIFNYIDIVSGLRRILWGLFKKVVVADRISVIVNHVYATSDEQNGLTLLFATYLFAFQIYCDFSGYSDIAIGSSRILGIKIMENFKAPYFSKSISEFWSRWHISLSTWFRDYVYFSLGGNRVKISRMLINILIVFVVSGFWHGANLTFIVWGLIHGLLLIVEYFMKLDSKVLTSLSSSQKLIRILVNFNLVTLAWIFFRAHSIHHAIDILNSIFTIGDWQFNINYLSTIVGGIPMVTWPKLMLSIVFVFIMITIEYGIYFSNFRQRFFALQINIRWGLYYAVLLCIILFGNHGNIEFIYFQF